ncbi:MAG: amidase [Neisseria sp.]|nr:amidase [Neisseria sp.]
MRFDEYRTYDAIGLADLVRKKEVSSDELLQTALSRLDDVNPQLNLLAQDWRERAFAWQSSADGILNGVPFLLKDLLANWQNTPTWCGSALLNKHLVNENSALTQAYVDAGLRIFGKTTLPEFGLFPCTESRLHGITRNPWRLAHTCGGSSGGSAAAVAAGIVPVAHGGDGGGSIRLPAHNCGIFGLKPSRGRSSFAPEFSEAWQGLVCEHVLTRSVRDSALFLDLAAQTQNRALYRCPSPQNGFLASLQNDLPRLKIAVQETPWTGGKNDVAVDLALKHSLDLLQQAGHELLPCPPVFRDAATLSRAILIIIAGETAKIAVHFEQQTGRKLRYDEVEAATWALMVQGMNLSAGEMAWARDVLLEQSRRAEQAFSQFDVIVSPVCPRTTPKVGELMPSALQAKISNLLLGKLKLGKFLAKNPLIEAESQRAIQYIGYTMPFNLSGLPAMSVPLFWHDGLPIGTQFAAAHGREDLLLQLAQELEQLQPWAKRYPPI